MPLTEAISAVLAANSETNLLEIEEVFRDADSSMSAWRNALDRLGMSPQESRCALAGIHRRRVRGPPCGAPGERKIPPVDAGGPR